MSAAAVHRFDEAELVPSERSLRIGGKPVTVGARAFDLLVALVERAGRLVSKDELLDVVWGRVIVEEANLHVHISALRKLLGPKAIATIPGRGYRFEAKLGDGPGNGRAGESASLTANGITVAPTDGATDRATGATANGAAATPQAASPDALTRDAPPAVRANDRVSSTASAPSLQQPPELIGRDADLAELTALVSAHRIVTVVGPGGIGKTRIARAALWSLRQHYADGAAMVELASLTDRLLIPGAIAGALGLPIASTSDPAAQLVTVLRPLRVLLVLDNAEHVVEALATLAHAVLDGAPSVTLLVTSQIPLHVPNEQVMRLGRLALPDADAHPGVDEALGFGAIRLFDERIRALDRRFRLTPQNLPAVTSICRQLDGIALAIELAAARAPLLGLNVVAQRLDERFKLLKSGTRTAPTRQQTLEAAMDWSCALLTEAQRTAFSQLGVFAGGFSLPLAQQVLQQEGVDEWGSVDLLAELVDRSLVSVDAPDETSPDSSGAPRYRLLETGRAYALERLAASDEVEHVRARHAAAVRDLFETAWHDCWTMPERDFIALYEPEIDNLRAALDWAMRHSPVDAIAMMGASGRLWRWLSLHPEALARGHAAAKHVDATTPRDIAARLWETIAQLAGEIASVDSLFAARRALALYEALGDDRGRYVALSHVAFSFRSGSDEAEAAYATMQSIEDPAWPPAVRILGTKVRGGLASDARRLDEARESHEQRLALARAAGSEREINAALGNLADLALIAGDAREAVERGTQLVARLGRRQTTTRAIALGNLLHAQLALGSLDAARATQRLFVDIVERLGYLYVMYVADAMALLAARDGRWRAAALILGYADAAYAAQSQAREPNEAAARDEAAALLSRGAPAGSFERWLAEGATLDAPAVCALASGGD